MGDSVREVLTHDSGKTAISTLIGYTVILAVMTAVLFGGALLFFSFFG